MPRYFFDVSDNGIETVDDTGTDFDNDQAMRDGAIKILPAMAREELPDGAEHSFHVRVRDDQGVYRFEASLRLQSAWLKPQRG